MESTVTAGPGQPEGGRGDSKDGSDIGSDAETLMAAAAQQD